MKIFIITEGGWNIGLGHITRCVSLCQAFEEKGLSPRLMIGAYHEEELPLNSRAYTPFRSPPGKEVASTIDGADIVVIDSYIADMAFYKMAAALADMIVCIDDFNRLEYPEGVVVNGTIYAEEMGYRKNPDSVYLLGHKYTPLRRAFWDAPGRKVNEDIKSVMITFGGEPAGGMLANTLRFFAENYPDIFKNVVVGNDFFRSEEALAAKSENTRILCGLNADGILDIMLRSDIAVCGGGQTLYEMAAAGLSAVTIRLAENQRFNIEGWERAGFADYAGGYAEKDILQKVGKSVEKLKSRDERARRSAAGRLYSDGLGARRVVEAVLDRIERMKR